MDFYSEYMTKKMNMGRMNWWFDRMMSGLKNRELMDAQRRAVEAIEMAGIAASTPPAPSIRPQNLSVQVGVTVPGTSTPSVTFAATGTAQGFQPQSVAPVGPTPAASVTPVTMVPTGGISRRIWQAPRISRPMTMPTARQQPAAALPAQNSLQMDSSSFSIAQQAAIEQLYRQYGDRAAGTIRR